VSLPKLAVPTLAPAADAFGLAEPRPGTVRLTLLSELKDSPRNCKIVLSETLIFLSAAKSVFDSPDSARRFEVRSRTQQERISLLYS